MRLAWDFCWNFAMLLMEGAALVCVLGVRWALHNFELVIIGAYLIMKWGL